MSEKREIPRASGRCHCGAVAYDVHGPLRDVIECHCGSCRRVSGGVWHGAAARLADVEIHDQASALTWYRSSEQAQRGFCNKCGSSLFFRRDGGERLSIAGGSLDRPSGLKLSVRIFTGETPDYGDWRNDVPSFETWPPANVFDVPDR